MAKTTRYHDFARTQFKSMLGLFLLVLAGFYGANFGLTKVYDRHQHAAQITANYNDFWLIIVGQKEPRGQQSFERLAVSLQPFIKGVNLEQLPQSELIPHKIADISVPEGQFFDLHKQVGQRFFTGTKYDSDTTLCIDCSNLNTNFLLLFENARNGQLNQVLLPAKSFPHHTSLTLTPGHIPAWATILAALMLVSLISFGISALKDEDSPRDWTLNGEANPPKLAIMAMAPIWSLPRLAILTPSWPFRRLHAVRQNNRRLQSEAAALAQHPMGSEIRLARLRLEQLQQRRVEGRKQPKLNKATRYNRANRGAHILSRTHHRPSRHPARPTNLGRQRRSARPRATNTPGPRRVRRLTDIKNPLITAEWV